MRLPLVVSAVVAGMLLAGCTQSADDGVDSPDPSVSAGVGTDGDPSTPVVQPTCSMVSAAVVKATLGIDVQEPTQSTNDAVIGCAYAPATDGRTLVIRFRTGQDAAAFARGRQEVDGSGQPTTDVALFDGGYSSSTEFGDIVTNTLVARKGPVEMLVTADASIDAEKALITKVLGGLG
jgi:hypothetical protein